jgi:hypothetical protein
VKAADNHFPKRVAQIQRGLMVKTMQGGARTTNFGSGR